MLRKLEKYEILEEIGHGGMATVFRARDSRLDRLVAVKIMHPHLRGAREARIRFDREAKSVARLRHPNILEIYDNSDEASDEGFIVTELLTGPTLKVFAEAHPAMPAEVVACFGIALARALGAAHEAGIVHRDVKPENVLLHEDRAVKLTDFGIAQMLDSQSFTATGQILGSPGHMAPEQIEGGECDVRVDVFSLGTVLYYLATGKLPFVGRNPHTVLKRVMDGDYADPLRVRPAIGGRFRAIITRCLQHDPAARYASAKELEQELVAFLAEVGIDDPVALLRDYLGDPDGATARLSPKVVAALTANGKAAADRGDVPAALDAYNRVLAIDEGNPKVLGLIDGLGRRSRNRRAVLGLGVGLGVVGAIAAAWAAGMGISGPRETTPDAGVLIAAEPPGDAALVVATADDAATADDSGQERDASTPPAVDAGARIALSPNGIGAQVPRANGPRHVVFDPFPENMSISVDGSDYRDYGDLLDVDLPPGPHRFAARTSLDCCDEWAAEVSIPAGDGTFRLRIALPPRAARLIVRARTRGDGGLRTVFGAVEIGGLRGRANEDIAVPMTEIEAFSVPIRVTAEGFRAYEGSVDLRAGRTTTVAAELVPTGPSP